MSDVAASQGARVLCFVEHEDAGPLEASLRALTVSRSLTTSSDQLVVALVNTPAASTLQALASYGVGLYYVITLEGVGGYAPVGWSRALGDLLTSLDARVLVSAGTDRGNEVMAHLGATKNLPMVANCLSAKWRDESTIELSRQRWAGSLIEDTLLESSPALLTVAFDGVSATPAETPSAPQPFELHLEATPSDRSVMVEEWRGRGGGVALTDARVVVGGGRGVGNEENFGPLDELAALLGGAVGVSRVVTSLGWRPHSQQVGQTGSRISPELYLACGISGATQHLAGCRSAKHVVAINTDADAPMITRADYAIIGDVNTILPALISALQRR